MKAHIVLKTYSNGATAIQRVFSSRKRALEWVEWFFLESAEADGWQVHSWKDADRGRMYRLVPPSLDPRQEEVISVQSEEIY